MKHSKKAIGFSVAIIVIVLCVIAYFAAPPYLYKSFFDKSRKEAGLQIKTMDIPGFQMVYAEGGSGEPLILIHGFGGSKDNWIYFAKALTPQYRVIIPDLPGFGDSSKPQDKSYSIKEQVKRVDQFLAALKINKAHFVGNSMGGSIAGMYSITYPQKVKTLALFDTGGVMSPIKSELFLLREKGINPLVVKETGDFDRLLRMNFYTPPRIPSIIKKYLASQAIEAAPMNELIFGELSRGDMWTLGDNLDKIQAPTLIVWGDSDKILHVSTVDILKKNIKNSTVVIIKECGHVPMLEKPRETAAAYRAFLEKK